MARNPLVEGAPREIHIATHRQGATQGHAAGKGKSYTLLHSQTFSGHASHLYCIYCIFWDLLRGAQAEICHTIDVGGIGANHSANSTHLKSKEECGQVHTSSWRTHSSGTNVHSVAQCALQAEQKLQEHNGVQRAKPRAGDRNTIKFLPM